jgi:VCBS repeat-containing protein
MASMTFLINDSSTSNNNPLAEITIKENANGSLSFSIRQIAFAGAYLGDLRGFFFDVADESLIGSLIASSSGTLTEYVQGNDSVKDLGQGANMQGLLGSDGGYDFGLEIGTSGIGSDDIRGFDFTLASSSRALTIDDFANVDFGLRVTSVGQDANGDGVIDTSRTLSSKISETTFDPVTASNDSVTVQEDASASGNVLSNDSGLGAKTLLSVSYGATTWNFSGSGPIVIAIAGGAILTISADGAYSVDASGADALYQGQEVLSAISYVVQQTVHGDTATDEGQLSIKVVGINDPPVAVADNNGSDAVTEAGVNPSNTPYAGDASATGNVLSNDTDVDTGDTKSVVAVNGVPGNVGLSIQGTYGRLTLAADGTWNYVLDNLDSDTNALARGATARDVFTYTMQDSQGATSTTNLSINITGTNDAPTIISGPGMGSVVENLNAVSIGSLAAIDPDTGAQQSWSVVGGTSAEAADYRFVADNFKITKNGGAFFEDTFADGVPPGSSPTFANGDPHTYGLQGAFQEAGGKLILDSDDAVTAISVGTPDPFVGNFATVRSNINPADLARGLKSDDNFIVEGLFDLIIPDSPREVYGIRLNDRLVGGNGTPPDQLGDDLIELVVRRGQDGLVRVQLRELDIANDQTINIGGVILNPPPGADQILLRMSHSVSNVGAIVPSFDFLSGGVAIGSATLPVIGRIFGTETPAFTGDDENWTRAQVIAYAPAITDSTLAGTYGALTVSQSGAWTYTLDNSLLGVQNLAEGETRIDSFLVQVTDEHGASDTESVNITVTGRNDRPDIVTGNVSRAFGEDAASILTATGAASFFDIDLADTHIVSSSLSGTPILSGGGVVPAGVIAAAATAMSATLFDPATGDSDGQYTWNFALESSLFQFLAENEVLTLSYNIAITDNHGAGDAQVVTVNVAGSNDAPEFTDPDDIYDFGPIGENQSAGVVVGAVSATDIDVADSQFYEFANGTQSSGPFVVNRDTGVITTSAALDYESAANHVLSVAVRDRISGGLTDTATVNVAVRDEIEATAKTIEFTGINNAPNYTEDGFTFTATGNHTDENNALFWHDFGANPGDNDIIMSYGGQSFSIVSMDILNIFEFFQIHTDNGTFSATGTGANIAVGLDNIHYAILETGGGGARIDNIDVII